MRPATWRRLRGAFFCAALAVVLGVPDPAEARVVRIEIERVESPTFEGRAFGDVGPYEKLVGRVFGEVDPASPENAVITDIELAPRNPRGLVEYVADLLILRPVDPSKGNGRIFYELNNRGRMLSLGQLNDARSGGNDPTAAADAGNGFLMRRGYTFVSSGWDATAAPDGTPVADCNADRRRPGRLAHRGAGVGGVRRRQRLHADRHAHLSGREQGHGAGEPHGTDALHRRPGTDGRRRVGVHRLPARSACVRRARGSSRDACTSSRTRPATRRWPGSALPPCATSSRSCVTRRRTTRARRIRWRARSGRC